MAASARDTKWIRCNQCFAQLGSNMTMWLTDCFHLYCGKCLGLDNISLSIVEVNCVICNNKEIKARRLHNKMGSDYIRMFFPPKEQIRNAEQKHMDELNKVDHAVRFQHWHKEHYMKHLLEENNMAKIKNVELQKDNTTMRDEMGDLKAKLNKSRENEQHYKKLLDEYYRKENMKDLRRLVQQQQQHAVGFDNRQGQLKRKHPSLNGNTPLGSPSFADCMSSTPVLGVGINGTHNQFENVFCFNGRDDDGGQQNDTFSTLTILSRQQQSAHNLLDITPSRAFHENIIAGQMIMIQSSPILARIKSPKKPSPKKPSPKKPSPKKPQSPIRTSGENRQDKQNNGNGSSTTSSLDIL